MKKKIGKKYLTALAIFCLVFVELFFVILYNGCGNKNDDGKTKKDVNLYFAVFKDDSEVIKELCEAFSQQNEGINVRITELAKDSDENNRLIFSMLAGNEIKADLIAIEDAVLNEYIKIDYLKPCNEYLTLDFSEYPRQFKSILCKNNKLYAVPFELDATLLAYRSDLASGGADYEALAENPGLFSAKGLSREDLLSLANECILFENDVSEGLKIYKRLCENSKDKNNNCITDFKNGNSSYLKTKTSCYLQLKYGSGLPGGAVRAKIPQAKGRALSSAKLTGIAVNKKAEKEKDEAISKFLNYFLDEDIQLKLAKKRGTLPLKLKYYSYPIVSDFNEYNELFADILPSLNYRNAADDYSKISDSAYKALCGYVEGRTSLDEAAEKMKEVYGK